MFYFVPSVPDPGNLAPEAIKTVVRPFKFALFSIRKILVIFQVNACNNLINLL